MKHIFDLMIFLIKIPFSSNKVNYLTMTPDDLNQVKLFFI